MASCAECVHVEVCTSFANMILDAFNVSEDDAQCLLKKCTGDATVCNDFADRSRFVELPCRVSGDCFFVNQNGTIQRATLERVYMFSTSTELFLNDGREIYSTSLNESNIELFPTYEEAEQALKEREEDEGKGAGVSVGGGEACDRGRAAE